MLSSGGARPGQGGRSGGPRILRFLWPQHQAEAEQEEIVQVQGCSPRGTEPEEKKLQTLERGETVDQALGMGVMGGVGGGASQRPPRASPGGSVLSSSPQVSCQ